MRIYTTLRMRQHFIHYIRKHKLINITLRGQTICLDTFFWMLCTRAHECSIYFLFEFKANATAIMKDKPTKENKTDVVWMKHKPAISVYLGIEKSSSRIGYPSSLSFRYSPRHITRNRLYICNFACNVIERHTEIQWFFAVRYDIA